MKKISLIGMLCFSLTATAFAQSSPFEWGVKGGADVATLLNDASESAAGSRTGFYGGVFTHIHLSPHVALQPELMYSAQGAAYPNDEKQKLEYINLPVLGQYMFGRGFRLEIGPQLGYLSHSEWEGAGGQTSEINGLKKWDFAWALGGSYLTSIGLGLDVRYNLGLTDMSKTGSDIKNRCWQMGLFYKFPKRQRA